MKIHLVLDWQSPKTCCGLDPAGKPTTLALFQSHREWERFGKVGCYNCWMASRRLVHKAPLM